MKTASTPVDKKTAIRGEEGTRKWSKKGESPKKNANSWGHGQKYERWSNPPRRWHRELGKKKSKWGTRLHGKWGLSDTRASSREKMFVDKKKPRERYPEVSPNGNPNSHKCTAGEGFAMKKEGWGRRQGRGEGK